MSFNLAPSFDVPDTHRVTLPAGPKPQPTVAVGTVIQRILLEHDGLIAANRVAYDIDNSLARKGLGHISVVPEPVHRQVLNLRQQLHTAVQYATRAAEVAPPKQPAPKKRVSAKRPKR